MENNTENSLGKKTKKIKSGRIFMIILLILIIVLGIYHKQTISYTKKILDKISPPTVTNEAALIGKEIITIDELNKEYEKLPDMTKFFKTKGAFLEEMINERLLLKKVEELSIIIQDSEIDKQIDDIKQAENLDDQKIQEEISKIGLTYEEFRQEINDKLAINKYLNANVFNNIAITDEEIEDYYNQNIDQFKVGDQVTVSHILIANDTRSSEDALAIITAIRERVDKEDFTDLIEEYSEDPSSVVNKGRLTFGKGEMVPEFEKVAFGLGIGQISQPVQTSYGYHLIKLENKELGRILSLDEVREGIKSELEYNKKVELIQIYLDELKKEFDVKIIFKE